MVQGFIFQATYRIHQGIPVVYLFGRLQQGGTFVLQDHRQRPHFYVQRTDADKVRNARVRDCGLRDFAGRALSEVEVQVPGDAPPVRDALHRMGVATYEADVRFAMRYLIDRNIRGGIAISGDRQPGTLTDWLFVNPEVAPADVEMTPRVLSFDIETNPNGEQLLAIACYGLGVDQVVVVDPKQRDMPANAVGVANEKLALQWFCELVAELDVDVLTGWNVIDFDLSVLSRVAKRVGFDLQLGRERGAMRIREAQGYFGSGQANIPGRLVLDGIDLLRGAFVRMDDYSLDAVALSVLGEGKTLTQTDGGPGKVEQILHTYRHDLASFTQYARTDARLALQIVERQNLVRLAFARSKLTGMPPDRVAASIASFDFLYMSVLRQRQVAAPSVTQGEQNRIAQGGGAVFEPKVGRHENVWVCDFKSLYPSIIRTFQIDPLGFHLAQHEADPIRTEDGTGFTRQVSILPGMLDQLFPQREAAKSRGDDIASQAIKILMNSFYGVLGTPACRFYNPHLANAITSQGRHLLNWSRSWFEQRGYVVLYGDTDSVFVRSGIADPEQAIERAHELVGLFNQDLADYLRQTYEVDSRLELEFEKLYTQLFLASVRGGSQGARKRYAGQKYGDDKLEFVGMEVVRRDWTELAKHVQRELYARLFSGDEVATYLKQTVSELRAGQLDDWLIYRKGLRKPASSYTTNIPPHVQAVNKSKAPPPRVVAYVITTQGPQLVDESSAPLDYEHYLERQVKPVALPVLETLNLSFDQVIGDDRQIALF